MKVIAKRAQAVCISGEKPSDIFADVIKGRVTHVFGSSPIGSKSCRTLFTDDHFSGHMYVYSYPMSLYALVSVDLHTCCCNVLVGRDCSTRHDAYKLLDGTGILKGEAAGPNGLGNGSRREVRMGIEFFFTIVGSQGGLLARAEILFLLVRIGDIDCFC